jgi:DNA-directed RNA polymerase subunit F
MMQVASQSIVLLSNAEVLDLLKEVSTKGKRGKRSQSNTATISYETMKYLEETPASLMPHMDLIRELTSKLKPFNLTKSEKLEIINHLPTSLVELQLVIEESEERLTEDQMNQLLNIITCFVESVTPSGVTPDEPMETSPTAAVANDDT